MKTQRGFFDEDSRLETLSKLGDSLEKLSKTIDFEIFRDDISAVFKKNEHNLGGRPPFDCVMMFKIIVLQKVYNLSSGLMEFQLNDRLTFMRFIGLELKDICHEQCAVAKPDAKTIWLFKDTLSKSGVERKLFAHFSRLLKKMGVIQNEGRIVDATFVDAPRQHNHHDENKVIKEGKIPDTWSGDDSKSKHKLCQKDTDARWAKKENKTHYGYKNHVKADAKSKMIVDYTVTNAVVHDSNELKNLVKSEDKIIYADSGYVGKEAEVPSDVDLKICRRAYRKRPLTADDKKWNKAIVKIRCRIEHIFGFMTNSMHALFVRSIGQRELQTT